ncbi:hypothetical protein ULB03_13845 [Nitrospirillum sp. BR 11828]|nr:hypothetical protein [Nitrospirillum sp. BR 11828]MDZ5648201.1 hypothetical protein [Nitrospirillum sp. BR 11828]
MTRRPTRSRRPAQPVLSLGPLLLARGGQGDRWRISAVIVTEGGEEPPDLTVTGVSLPVPPRWLGKLPEGKGIAWRYDFAVPRGAQDGRADYGFLDLGTPWSFAVPGMAVPPRLVLADAAGDAPPGPSPWSALLSRHRVQPFHLFIVSSLVPADSLLGGLAPDGRLTGPAQAERRALMASVPHLAAWVGPGTKTAKAAAPRALHRLLALGLGAEDKAENAWAGANDLVQGLTLNRLGVLALDAAVDPDTLAERLDRLRGCRAALVLTRGPRAPMTGWRAHLARLRPAGGGGDPLGAALDRFRQASGMTVVHLRPGAPPMAEEGSAPLPTLALPTLTTDARWLEARLGAQGLDLTTPEARPLPPPPPPPQPIRILAAGRNRGTPPRPTPVDPGGAIGSACPQQSPPPNPPRQACQAFKPETASHAGVRYGRRACHAGCLSAYRGNHGPWPAPAGAGPGAGPPAAGRLVRLARWPGQDHGHHGGCHPQQPLPAVRARRRWHRAARPALHDPGAVHRGGAVRQFRPDHRCHRLRLPVGRPALWRQGGIASQ